MAISLPNLSSPNCYSSSPFFEVIRYGLVPILSLSILIGAKVVPFAFFNFFLLSLSSPYFGLVDRVFVVAGIYLAIYIPALVAPAHKFAVAIALTSSFLGFALLGWLSHSMIGYDDGISPSSKVVGLLATTLIMGFACSHVKKPQRKCSTS